MKERRVVLDRPQEDDLSAAKQRIREHVWWIMEQRGVSRFPRPIWGRILNFEGAEKQENRIHR